MGHETRDRIVDATLRVLGRGGYADTSIKDIAVEADVAPGLVHYYFKTKDELIVEAVRQCCQKLMPPLDGDPTQAALAALEMAKHPAEPMPLYWSLLLEMVGLAMHNEPVRATLLEFVHMDRDYTERAARAVLAQREDVSPDVAPAVAGAIWGAILGIQVQRLLDPTFDAAAAVDALAAMALR
jgi:AcrR family transcriptional regulator